MQTIVVEPPAETIVTVDEAKRHARIALDLVDDDLDALILAYIKAATRKLEAMTSRAFVTRTLETTFDWPLVDLWYRGHRTSTCTVAPKDYRLPVAPVIAVSEVGYTDFADASQILDPSYYQAFVGTPGRLARAHGVTWPRGSRLRAVYTAGYGAAEDVPDDAKLIVNILVAHYYDRREPVTTGGVAELPFSVQSLADSLRWGSYVQ